jgi:TonB-dependent receptor
MHTYRALFLTVLLLLTSTVSVAAQEQETGRIIGRVVDANSAKALQGVQVIVNDGVVGTLTDLNGRFVLVNVPAGTVTLTAQSLGYATKTVTDLVVEPNAVVAFDITLEQQAVAIEGITVSAALEAGSATALLDERRTSVAAVEAIGAQEIARRPDGDAAQVAKRLTGVTVADDKYVFIRGLGERYSQTTLNGASLPSPEPEREVVPLDIFPSGFLESLTTQKTYTPDQPADFSGGSVQIQTKKFPDRFTVRFGVGTTYNSLSQFEDGFLNFASGGRDFLGLDDGTRGQPQALTDIIGDLRSGERLPSDPAQRIAIGQALRDTELAFAPGTATTPVPRNFSLSIGGRNDWRDDGEIGYFLAGTYSDNYTIRGGGCDTFQPGTINQIDTSECLDFERKWRTSAFDPATADFATPNVDYAFTRGLRSISWGTVANLTANLTPTQQISLQTTVNLSTDDEARTYQGGNREDIGGLLQSTRARWVERLLLWSQLAGEHQSIADSRIEWRVTASRAERDEPLLRESVYLEDNDDFFLLDLGESGRYFSSNLIDEDVSAGLDWSFPFEFGREDGAIKIGGQWRGRTRDFGARRLIWDFLGARIADIDAALETATIVGEPPQTGSEFRIDDVFDDGDVYGVDEDRFAGYAMLEFPVSEKLQLVGGVRVEDYTLSLATRTGATANDIETVDVAPSLTAIYSVNDDVKIRASASRTVDRPEFRELAPFQFTEATSLRQLFGNPELDPATITAGDLRFDFFPGAGEILSAGAFYKRIDSPIENVFIAAASTAFSFQNADQAEIFGLEADAQLRLSRLGAIPVLEWMTAQANYSWIDSEVEVLTTGAFDPTNNFRPLVGQAPYVVNAGLNYAGPSGIEAGVFFNRFGERIDAAGGAGVPDIYEQPRNVLDASLGFPLGITGARARVNASNLLDAPYLFVQSANGITREQRRFTVGRTISVGLSWEF